MIPVDYELGREYQRERLEEAIDYRLGCRAARSRRRRMVHHFQVPKVRYLRAWLEDVLGVPRPICGHLCRHTGRLDDAYGYFDEGVRLSKHRFQLIEAMNRNGARGNDVRRRAIRRRTVSGQAGARPVPISRVCARTVVGQARHWTDPLYEVRRHSPDAFSRRAWTRRAKTKAAGGGWQTRSPVLANWMSAIATSTARLRS
jgi:hypothetical protein